MKYFTKSTMAETYETWAEEHPFKDDLVQIIGTTLGLAYKAAIFAIVFYSIGKLF